LAMDAPDPIDSDIANKIVFYQYTDWHSWFNTWPGPCTWLTWFSYKTQIWWTYISWGTSNSCGASWYTRTVWNAAYLTLFQSWLGWNYWGSWMWWANSWYNNWWWYLR
jgi:hypothetical protein